MKQFRNGHVLLPHVPQNSGYHGSGIAGPCLMIDVTVGMYLQSKITLEKAEWGWGVFNTCFLLQPFGFLSHNLYGGITTAAQPIISLFPPFIWGKKSVVVHIL